MGIYIGSNIHTKERLTYLTEVLNCVAIEDPGQWDYSANNPDALICVFDNNYFLACAVIYSQREYDSAHNTEDDRPRHWYKGPKDLVFKAAGVSACKFLREVESTQ